MLPSQNDQSFLRNPIGVFSANSNHGDWSAHDSWPDTSNSNFAVIFDTLYHLFEIVEIVGEGMSKLHNIFVDCEVVLKTQGFVQFFIVIFVIQVISIIVDIKSFSPPRFFPIFLAPLRSHNRFHPLLIQWFCFVLNYTINTKLTMLILAMKLFLLLWTLKLNHWVNPLVFISFWRTKSYVFVSTYIFLAVTLKTAKRFPD